MPGVWFHVAITYNGHAGAVDNTRFYWTRVSPGVEWVNSIGTGSLTVELDSATMQGDFSIGNEARDINGNTGEFIGSIDEVRISAIARSADDFLFAADSDRDSLPDIWEAYHLGNISQGPNDDFDSDGSNNRAEYLLGLDPADRSSSFRAAIQPTASGYTLAWPSSPGVSFRVERSTTLTGTWMNLGTVNAGTWTDPNPPPERAFYRIVLLGL